MQTLGKAMVTKMVSTYTTLTLTYLEENLYEIIGEKIQPQYYKIFTSSWKDNYILSKNTSTSIVTTHKSA